VWNISRDRSRSEIKSCNPKNQMRDNPEKKWYLSQSGCGIKSGINTTFLARNCGSVSVAPELTMPPRRTGFIEYMPQGQRTLTEVDGVVEIGPDTLRPYTAASSRGWPMGRAGAATEVDNLTAGGFFGWMGREQLGAGRVKDGASISCSRSSRRPLRLGGEGKCCSVHLPTLATTASTHVAYCNVSMCYGISGYHS
jgi:hypothetical protein